MNGINDFKDKRLNVFDTNCFRKNISEFLVSLFLFYYVVSLLIDPMG